MKNERLRDAMHVKGIPAEQFADELGVDPKTVERWITQGREPYPKYRQKIAVRLDERELYLWPSLAVNARNARAAESEILKVYTHRNAVPSDLWDRLVGHATDRVDILVYVGMFMTEKPTLLGVLKEKAGNGARVRLLFGDRDSDAVVQRSIDEGIGPGTISAKIDHAIAHLSALASVPGIEIRTHGTVLYNSIYRFDDEMIVNPHIYGRIASHAPALHLRRISTSELFDAYADSFGLVWDDANPLAK